MTLVLARPGNRDDTLSISVFHPGDCRIDSASPILQVKIATEPLRPVDASHSDEHVSGRHPRIVHADEFSRRCIGIARATSGIHAAGPRRRKPRPPVRRNNLQRIVSRLRRRRKARNRIKGRNRRKLNLKKLRLRKPELRRSHQRSLRHPLKSHRAKNRLSSLRRSPKRLLPRNFARNPLRPHPLDQRRKKL